MAKAEPDVEIEETPIQPVQSRSRLIILLVFSAVVLLEMIILLLWLPKSSVPPQADDLQTSGPAIPQLEPESSVGAKVGDLVSNPIEEPFTIPVPSEDGSGGYMIGAQFALICEKSKQAKFTDLYGKTKDYVRSEIVTILRSSKIEDLNDPKCTVIRNKVLRKVNEIFAEPQPLVKEVIALDFRATPM